MPALLMILRRLVQRRRSRSDRARSKAGSVLQTLTAIELLSAVRPSRRRRSRRVPLALALGGVIAGALAALGKRRRSQSSLGAPDAGLDIDAPNTGADTATTTAAAEPATSEPAASETASPVAGVENGEPEKPHGDPVAEEARATKG